MLFVDDSNDLNVVIFNETIGFHVLRDFGLPRWYIRRLEFEICRSMYHGVEMNRDKTGTNLKSNRTFQKCYTQSVCATLESHFVDNGIIGSFKILNLSNMPTSHASRYGKLEGLELDVICGHYGQDLELCRKKLKA